LLAVWTAHVVPALLFEEDAERLVFAPDVFTVLAASAACVSITIVCGLTPVFVTSDDRPAAILQRESGGPSRAMRRLRVCLVVVQMTSCCVLVLSTAFLLSDFRAALQTSVGHRVGQPILVTVQAQPQPGTDISYFQHVEQAVKSMDGVSVMAWTGRLPGSQPVWQSFRIEPPHLPLREITMDIAQFTGESLKFFILPPKAGRLFGFGDQMCRVAVVDETAAEELFGANTVGRIVYDPAGLPVEIIGVLARNKRYVVKGRRPTIYYNYLDRHGPPTESLSHTFRAPTMSELAHVELDTNVVSSSYFNAMGLSLIAGQGLTNARLPDECRVGVINQEAADLYFGGKPVGGAVIDDRGVRTTIIGVVHSRPFGMFQRHAEPAIYLPMRQDCLLSMTLVAGVRDAKGTMLRDLRSRIEFVPGRGPAPVIVRTLATQLAHTAFAPLCIATVILATSTTTALTLGILGLFGALHDAARQRRRELAIRMALGAQRWRIAYQVLKEGSRLACAGTLIGTLGSLALRRLLVSITVGNSSPPLWVWLAAPLVLALAVVIASVLPTRRASIVNPLTVLREDN
jgi:ABC-type antimicrobial peptide transport system permease subunit